MKLGDMVASPDKKIRGVLAGIRHDGDKRTYVVHYKGKNTILDQVEPYEMPEVEYYTPFLGKWVRCCDTRKEGTLRLVEVDFSQPDRKVKFTIKPANGGPVFESMYIMEAKKPEPKKKYQFRRGDTVEYRGDRYLLTDVFEDGTVELFRTVTKFRVRIEDLKIIRMGLCVGDTCTEAHTPTCAHRFKVITIMPNGVLCEVQAMEAPHTLSTRYIDSLIRIWDE